MLLDRTARIISPWPLCMTGCVYSSLLTSHYDLPQTLGPVTYDDAGAFHRKLRAEVAQARLENARKAGD